MRNPSLIVFLPLFLLTTFAFADDTDFLAELSWTADKLAQHSTLRIDPNSVDLNTYQSHVKLVEFDYPSLSDSEKAQHPMAIVDLDKAIEMYREATGHRPRGILLKQGSHWCQPCKEWDRRNLSLESSNFLYALSETGDILLVKVNVTQLNLKRALTVPFTWNTRVLDWYSGIEIRLDNTIRYLKVSGTPNFTYFSLVSATETNPDLIELERIRSLDNQAFKVNYRVESEMRSLITAFRAWEAEQAKKLTQPKPEKETQDGGCEDGVCPLPGPRNFSVQEKSF